MRKDYSKKLGNKNKLRCVFEDRQNVEFLCGRNNSSLFTYSSDTKKREMNLVLGSLFSNEILDLFEFEVTNYIPISHFAQSVWIDSCMKPVILFQGDVFETEFNYERLKKFFLDYFRLHDVEDVDVSDLKRILVISAGDNKVVKIRSYQIDGDINEYNVSIVSINLKA